MCFTEQGGTVIRFYVRRQALQCWALPSKNTNSEPYPISQSNQHVVFVEFARPHELFQQTHSRSDFMHAWGSIGKFSVSQPSLSSSVFVHYTKIKGLVQGWPLSLRNITPFKCFLWDALETQQRSPQTSWLALDTVQYKFLLKKYVGNVPTFPKAYYNFFVSGIISELLKWDRKPALQKRCPYKCVPLKRSLHDPATWNSKQELL